MRKEIIASLCLLISVAWGQTTYPSEPTGNWITRDSVAVAMINNAGEVAPNWDVTETGWASGAQISGSISANLKTGTRDPFQAIQLYIKISGESGNVRLQANGVDTTIVYPPVLGTRSNSPINLTFTVRAPGSISYSVTRISGNCTVEALGHVKKLRSTSPVFGLLPASFFIGVRRLLEPLTTSATLEATFPETKVFQNQSGFEIQGFSGNAQVFDILGRQLAAAKIQESGTVLVGGNGILFLRLTEGRKSATKKYSIIR